MRTNLIKVGSRLAQARHEGPRNNDKEKRRPRRTGRLQDGQGSARVRLGGWVSELAIPPRDLMAITPHRNRKLGNVNAGPEAGCGPGTRA